MAQNTKSKNNQNKNKLYAQGCMAEHGRPHNCGVDELSLASTSRDLLVRPKSHHAPPPLDSPYYGYGDLPPVSYAAPAGARYAYGPAAPSLYHTDYPSYCVGPDRPRCGCGDHGCAQLSVHGVYDVGGRQSQPVSAQYFGHHVALPPGATPAPVYPGMHQVLYPADHFQIVRPPPPPHQPATHFHPYRHHYPPLSSAAATHRIPVPPQQLVAGCADSTCSSVTTSAEPIIAGKSSSAQANNADCTPASTADAHWHNAVDSTAPVDETSTSLIEHQHDATPTRDTDDATVLPCEYSHGNSSTL